MPIPDTGLAEMANLWGAISSAAAMTHIAVGSGLTAFSVDDTTLKTEIEGSGLIRATATVTRVTTDIDDDTIQMVKTFTVTGTVTIREVGIFNAGSGGDLGGRTVLETPKDVVNGSSYTCTYKTIFSRS